MTAALQTAVANEALELAYQFRQNAALKHGLPDCRRQTIGSVAGPANTTTENVAVTRTETTTAATTATDTPSPGGGAVPQPQQSLLRRAAPFIVTAATGAGLPLLAYYGFHKTQPPPEPPPIVQQAPDDGSLLEVLQDRGLHLPEGQWPTK